MKRLFFGLLSFLFLLPCHASEGLFQPYVTTLDNGLKVVVTEHHRSPVVEVMVLYKAGSADDPAGKSGVAHFLEHVTFKGLAGLEENALNKRVARIGGVLNAYTNHDYTAYYAIVAKEHLEEILGYEAKRMTSLVLSPAHVEKERQVILEERSTRVDNNPHALAQETFATHLFCHHPYRTPVIGWEDDIKNITLEDLLQFHRNWYGPDNAIVMITGDISHEEALILAQKHFGAIPKRKVHSRRRLKEPLNEKAETRLVFRDQRVNQINWQRFFQAPNYRSSSFIEATSLEVLAYILGATSTSYLYQTLVENKKLLVSIATHYEGTSFDNRHFSIVFTPKEGVPLPYIEEALDHALSHFIDHVLTQENVEKYKKRMLAGLVYQKDSLHTISGLFAPVLANDHSLDQVLDIEKRVMEVTPESLKAVAKKVLIPSHSATLILGPK